MRINFFLEKRKKNKYFFLSLLILFSFFLAFNHYPPVMSLFESVIIYRDFFPTNNPLLVLSISEDPSTTGPFNTFGYAFLMVSRYIADVLGHTLLNIRLPSILFGLISLFLFYIIINRRFGWRIAAISTLLLATNQYFITFQHFLLVQMVSMASILFCIERFQNLIIKESKFAIISFGFACALATLHYWTGRWCVICLLLFYLIDFKRFSIWDYKSYLNITNIKKIKIFLFVFLNIVIILTLFYPGNIFLLFSPEFIYPSFRSENYSHTAYAFYENTNYFSMMWNNLIYYFKYFIFDRSNSPTDLLLIQIPYPVEYLVVIFFSLVGIISSVKKKFNYSSFFFLYIFLVTFFPALLSSSVNPTDLADYFEKSGRSANATEAMTTLGAHRVFFHIPFLCLMSVLGGEYIYKYLKNKNFSINQYIALILIIFFTFRIYAYFDEIKRFNNEINSYKFDFSEPARSDALTIPEFPDFKEKKEKHYNQIYFYSLAKFISKKIKNLPIEKSSKKILYIPAEIFTPYYYYHGDMGPNKGSKYYFPMYLTFYLQENGINVSYLVKNEDTKQHFLKKAVSVVDRYKKNKDIFSVNPSSDDHYYPKNDGQEKIVKLFVIIFDTLESFDLGKSWLDSIRRAENYPASPQIGSYHINKTSRKSPDFIIITNNEELIQTKEKSNYPVVLSLPL